ncbi:MAG: ABC transporter permease [Chitinophagaceae bacterium]|nr:MAG: ABC transporter permease [Chitinophagaceae bacterium]
MKLIFKILFSGQNRLPLVFAILGSLLGLFILLTSLQIFTETQRAIKEQIEAQESASYLIINKKIDFFSAFGGGNKVFSDAEIEELKSKDFIDDVGAFTSNTFRVIAGLGEAIGLQGDFFLEGVDDEFLDIQPDDWGWEEGSNFIPLIVSGEFMRLYNFSIALSQGLPQVAPGTIEMITFEISIPYNGNEAVYETRVVGFSDRIPTILAPLNFIEYANQKYAGGKQPKISRIILSTDDPANPELKAFLAEKDYETNLESLRGGTGVAIINAIMSITGTIGLLFLILSLVLFIMNFQLIISRAKEEISILLDLGYSARYLNKVITFQFLLVLVPTIILSLILVFLSSFFIETLMSAGGFQFKAGLNKEVLGASFIFLIVAVLINLISVNRNIFKMST